MVMMFRFMYIKKRGESRGRRGGRLISPEAMGYVVPYLYALRLWKKIKGSKEYIYHTHVHT